ncbi:MAG: DUF465 domain-containing protein [Alphaproteobacteria bacterium]|nr:DUF465 domain-containing protein [Alphaproteobacteria bacterium]
MNEKQEKHLKALKERHQALHAQIEEEEAQVVPNEMLIQELKKQKLKLKDEIEALSKQG